MFWCGNPRIQRKGKMVTGTSRVFQKTHVTTSASALSGEEVLHQAAAFPGGTKAVTTAQR